MEKINIGLVGAGRIAGHHIRSIRKLKKLKIVSICDLDIDKAKLLAYLNSKMPNHMLPRRLKVATISVGHRFKKA